MAVLPGIVPVLGTQLQFHLIHESVIFVSRVWHSMNVMEGCAEKRPHKQALLLQAQGGNTIYKITSAHTLDPASPLLGSTPQIPCVYT